MIWEDMTPGERDVLVDARVMGVTHHPARENPLYSDDLPRYSQDMGAAWQALEHLAPDYLIHIVRVPYAGWQVTLTWENGGRHEVSFACPTAAEAICRTALDAVEVRAMYPLSAASSSGPTRQSVP